MRSFARLQLESDEVLAGPTTTHPRSLWVSRLR